MLMALATPCWEDGSGTESEAEAVSGQRQGMVAAGKRQMGPIRGHRGASKLGAGGDCS